MGVGMPEFILLQEFGSQVWFAFGDMPFHVGSSLKNKTGWRDVDIRLILEDKEYKCLELGNPKRPHDNGKWVSLCLAYSALGKAMTGLPIDFQIQQRTLANKDFPLKEDVRSAIGCTPLRFKGATK